MLGIIRVLTTDQDDILQEHGAILHEKYKINSISRCIPSQPNGIYDDRSEEIAIPKIIELARQMEAEGKVDVLTISCAADPALEETRAQVKIPVLGAGICTGFSTIRLKDYLRSRVNVPIIDLVEAQGIAYQLVNRGGNE
jgi:Asp/Glu/hydantoin racemase